MLAIAQRVDDRHGRCRRQFFDRLVLEGARRDGIDPPRQPPCYIPHRLPYSQPDIARCEIDRVAIHLRHSRLETDACAQGRLFEQQSEGLRMGKIDELIPALQVFDSHSDVQNLDDLFRGDIEKRHERSTAPTGTVFENGRLQFVIGQVDACLFDRPGLHGSTTFGQTRIAVLEYQHLFTRFR